MTDCEWCGQSFDKYHAGDRFCSDKCRQRWHDERRKQERRDYREREYACLLAWRRDLPAREVCFG